jgi:NADPH-dependent 2,4-dienoyl-CoA reductase/sulfur reductase-like enzyme/rhodanese-related sulfurtransferase
MRIIIIGAVAAGTSAAAKARRNDEHAEIVIYEKDSFISYSGCGMPYYIGGIVKNAQELTPRDPVFFKSKYNVDIKIRHEVVAIDPNERSVQIRDMTTGKVFSDVYDKLVIATGASAIVPAIKGAEQNRVFTLRTINDMHRIKAYIDTAAPKTAVIIGTGFVGLEVCENLHRLGIEVTLIEKLPQVTSGLDSDMSVYVKEHIKNNGVAVYTEASVTEITRDAIILADGVEVPADLVLIATGVRPNTALAKEAGIGLGVAGAIRVNEKMQTNLPEIYACGDCIEHFHVVTRKPVYHPLGSTANKTGRIAGDCITGGNLSFRGILGTGIFRIFDMTVAQSGLSERDAKELGYDVVVCHHIKPNKPEYMGGQDMVIKGIADKSDGRLLGVQIVGGEGVDKRLDVFATAITYKAKVEDLFHLDLAYAPPFSTTKDPVLYTGMILDNAINRGRPLITAPALDALLKSGEKYNLIDARIAAEYEEHHIDTARSMPHEKLREAAGSLDKDTITITYCNKGTTGNAAQNILLGKGFRRVFNISGGQSHYSKMHNKE